MLLDLQHAALERLEKASGFVKVPDEVWFVVARHLNPQDRIAFALTCRTFLEAVRAASPKTEGEKVVLKTHLEDWMSTPCFSLSWFQWVFRSFKRRKGTRQLIARGALSKHDNHFCDSDLMYLAAFQGSKEVIEWLVSQGVRLDIKQCDVGVATGAASGGHLELLKWLKGKGCKFHGRTCLHAAREGRLHVLQWLRSQNPPCPWHMRTCEAAVDGGQLEVLQWLRSQDPPCPWNLDMCGMIALELEHHDILDWIAEEEWDEESYDDDDDDDEFDYIVDRFGQVLEIVDES
ncbi:F-box domain-containing protein [Chloropicon primus]|uniref:F-box domain-containing protein n=1 Tax=Chloropicon primus TaxID=1764295 RepID=A0A5B8MT78_9CHLO|nr:hypothetical protein A3770_11p62610 [Chloropicon primus]UPR02956.1 F-box domain-containing protein [Chloropicon primus]|eukprot:QDZ23743.1 hypothetical protein A3770_11p62610 [Chloropicon primus]